MNFNPNSFQTPNDYVDVLMPLLSNSELRVLIYATRRILGFQKRQDHISISQFVNGTRKKDDTLLDHGTGLSRQSVVNALESLALYKIMIEVAPNNPRVNKGAEYALQLEAIQVDMDGLEKRRQEWAKTSEERATRARSGKEKVPEASAVYGLDGVGAVYGLDGGPSSGYTAPRLAARPAPVYGLDTQKTVLNPDLNPDLNLGAGAPGSAPDRENRDVGDPSLIRNQRAFDALASFEKNRGEIDFSEYPEDTREIIREFCRLWNQRPPARSGRKGGQFAIWTNEARELREACGEFGLEALRSYHTAWKDLPLEKKFIPGRPGALTYFISAHASILRGKPRAGETDWSKVDPNLNTLEKYREGIHILFPERPMATQADFEAYLRQVGALR